MPTKSVSDLAKVVDRRLKRDGVISPGVRALTELLDAVYLTSLKTEEGRPLQIRVVLVDPSNPDPDAPRPGYARPDRWKITKLADSLPFTVPTLIKLSKAADPWSSSLAVYYDADYQFSVWGLVDQTVHFNTQLVRESDAGGYAPPGIFQVVAAGIADLSVYREFSFVARLQQDRLLKQQNDVFFFGPVTDRLSDGVGEQIDSVRQALEKPLQKRIKDWGPGIADHWLSTLCRLLISIQRHGGAVLITNSRADLNIKYKINYSRLPKALTKLWTCKIVANAATDVIGEHLDRDQDMLPMWTYLDENVKEREAEDCKDEITGCVRFIASLSCVDGLVLAAPNLTIRGFGVEIRTKREVEAAYLATSAKVRENTLHRIDPSHYGTRHRSMMRYCFAHPGSLGFVISQDGEIRAITKVGGKLVMWENLQVFSFFESEKPEPKKKQEALASHASSSPPSSPVASSRP